MLIVHALAYYGGYIGGIQTYVDEIVNIQKQKHNVTVIAAKRKKEQKTPSQANIIEVPQLFELFRVPFTPTMPRELLKRKMDVLHVHLPLPWLDLCAYIKKSMHPKTKLVVTLHNSIPITSTASHVFKKIQDITLKKALRKADAVTVPSKAFGKSMQYNIDYTVVPNGVNRSVYYPQGKAKDYVLFVGRMIPEKGFHILAQAMKIVRKTHPKLRLVAIYRLSYGHKKYKEKWFSYAKDFLEEHEGPSKEELSPFYSSARCFAFSSIGLDSFGLVQLEALSCGCPVVTSNLEGPQEIVNEKCGQVYNKDDPKEMAKAILNVLKRENKQMRNDCIEHAKKFDWRNINQRLMELYS